ncbi:MAG TPA: hypothetical protein VEB21_11885, partial [Terriglobales bacterium]|nr:hypothetical protein [Terriglobales bacterium]
YDPSSVFFVTAAIVVRALAGPVLTGSARTFLAMAAAIGLSAGNLAGARPVAALLDLLHVSSVLLR